MIHFEREMMIFTRVHVTITLDAWVACFGEQDFMIEAEMDVKNDETNNNGDRTQQNGDVNQQHLVSDYWNIHEYPWISASHWVCLKLTGKKTPSAWKLPRCRPGPFGASEA